jgi:hypothetical protein
MVTEPFNVTVTWMARRPSGVQNPQILDSFPQHSNSAGFRRLVLVILYSIRIKVVASRQSRRCRQSVDSTRINLS